MSLPSHFLLAANMQDILQVVVPIIFVILSGLGSLLGARAEKAKGAKPKVRGPQGGVRPAAPGAGPAGPPQDALRREVEEFLRKARGQAPQQQPRPVQQRPAARSPARPGAAKPVEPVQRSRPPLREPLSTVTPRRPQQLKPPAEVEQPHESVAQHVRTHLGEHPVTEHARHLAEGIGQADERMEEHLRERFTHKVGTLAQSVDANVKVSAHSPMIAELLTTLTRPGGARQLILASEILRRPEERWSRQDWRPSHDEPASGP